MTIADLWSQFTGFIWQVVNWFIYFVWAIWLVSIPLIVVTRLFVIRQIKTGSAYLGVTVLGTLLSAPVVQKTVDAAFPECLDRSSFLENGRLISGLSSIGSSFCDPTAALHNTYCCNDFRKDFFSIPHFGQEFSQKWFYIVAMSFCLIILLFVFGFILEITAKLISFSSNLQKSDSEYDIPFFNSILLFGSSLIPMIPAFILIMKFSSD